MSEWINEKPANIAKDNGVLIGKTSVDPENENSWWEVYVHEGKIVACSFFQSGWGRASCGDEITIEELKSYVDEDQLQDATRKAQELLKAGTV